MRGPRRLEDPGAFRRPRRDQRRPGLRPESSSTWKISIIRRSTTGSARPASGGLGLQRGTFNEDFGPDYFWQSAGRIGSDGWTAEVAIPLSSIRYSEADPQDWALTLYRVYPRDRNYQIYSVPVPRGASCFLCQTATLEGITGLPKGAHYVVAPYGAVTNTKTYPGIGGASDEDTTTQGKVGVDAKWLPDADTVVDATINPDFSQIESDTAQISVNERFARSFIRRRGPSSSSTWTCSRRRSRPSTPERSLRRCGAGA
jgi:hypothetical protein